MPLPPTLSNFWETLPIRVQIVIYLAGTGLGSLFIGLVLKSIRKISPLKKLYIAIRRLFTKLVIVLDKIRLIDYTFVIIKNKKPTHYIRIQKLPDGGVIGSDGHECFAYFRSLQNEFNSIIFRSPYSQQTLSETLGDSRLRLGEYQKLETIEDDGFMFVSIYSRTLTKEYMEGRENLKKEFVRIDNELDKKYGIGTLKHNLPVNN